MNPFKVHYNAHPFEVGDKVIMVTSGPRKPAMFTPRLQYRQVYVIRETGHIDDDGPVVRLVGVFGEPDYNGGEWWLRAGHFMLLSEHRANYAATMAARRGLQLNFKPDETVSEKPQPKKRQRRNRQPRSTA